MSRKSKANLRPTERHCSIRTRTSTSTPCRYRRLRSDRPTRPTATWLARVRRPPWCRTPSARDWARRTSWACGCCSWRPSPAAAWRSWRRRPRSRSTAPDMAERTATDRRRVAAAARWRQWSRWNYASENTWIKEEEEEKTIIFPCSRLTSWARWLVWECGSRWAWPDRMIRCVAPSSRACSYRWDCRWCAHDSCAWWRPTRSWTPWCCRWAQCWRQPLWRSTTSRPRAWASWTTKRTTTIWIIKQKISNVRVIA